MKVDNASQALNIVFMGTPDFAVYSLVQLIKSNYNISAVVTAPDRPAGRGQKLKKSPVKIIAEEHSIEVLQPVKLKDPTFVKRLEAIAPDLIIVVAFRVLPEIIWSLPTKGTVNLHASLLPDYRGAAPINWAIINGEEKTGVTTFFIDQQIDTGKVIFMDKVTITPDMNAGELHDILMEKGAALLMQTIDSIAGGNNPAIDQKEMASASGKTKQAPKISKDDCRINWDKDIDQIHNMVRGMSPFPGAWTILQNNDEERILKIYRTEKERGNHQYKPGSIITDKKNIFKVAVPHGFIQLKEVQLSGKRKMPINDFLRGYRLGENISLHG